MAQNRISESYDPIMELLADAIGGAQEHGTSIGLKQNDAAALILVHDALAGKPSGPGGVPPAVPGLKAVCNNAWQAAGFTDGSLAIPDNPLTLFQQFRAYFEINPTHERSDIAPGIHVTAAACEGAADAIAAASTASNEANSNAGIAKANYEAGIKAARSRLSGLRDELTQLLAADDARWYAFGFERPEDPETPETAENLVLTGVNQGDLFADWDNARRADRYRARVFNATTGAKLDEKIVSDSDANFTGLPVSIPLRVEVTSINTNGGESGPVSGMVTL